MSSECANDEEDKEANDDNDAGGGVVEAIPLWMLDFAPAILRVAIITASPVLGAGKRLTTLFAWSLIHVTLFPLFLVLMLLGWCN